MKTDKTVKGIAAAMAIALALMAGTVFTALALPEEGEGEEPDSQVTTQTTSTQTTSRETTTSQKPSSSNGQDGDDDDDGSTSGKSSSLSTSRDDDEDKTSRVSTSRDDQTSRDDDDDEPATSRKPSSSKAGGTLKPDDKEPNSEFDDISWGAQYEVETSMPETVSAAKPISKGIDNYYAIALKWIWLPILLICASLFGLIAVNYKAVKEKRLAEQAASRGGRPSDIPMRSGRPDRRFDLEDSGFDDALDDDDIYIPSDTSMRPAPRTGRQPAKRTPPAHRRPKGPRRPRD